MRGHDIPSPEERMMASSFVRVDILDCDVKRGLCFVGWCSKGWATRSLSLVSPADVLR